MPAQPATARIYQRLNALLLPWATRGPLHRAAYDFLWFGLKQGWACLFGGIMLGLIIGTRLCYPAHAALARYDFLVLAAVAVQAALLLLKMERWEEAVVILVYHIVGTLMEIFKTSHGSWEYPEAGVLKIMGVPLFSGFMYACIGSYLARVWRLFGMRFTRYPPVWATMLLAVASYTNFFADQFGQDWRWALFALSALLYGRTWVYFTPTITARRMPLILGFLLVALFIWLAENCGTLTATWRYPSQRHGWEMVPMGKIGSWYLLMILSFVLVSLLHRRELRAR